MRIEWKEETEVVEWRADVIDSGGRKSHAIIEKHGDLITVWVYPWDRTRYYIYAALDIDEAKSAAESWLLNQQEAT